MRTHHARWAILLLAVAALARAEVKVQVAVDRPDALYHLGDRARFTVTLDNGGAAVATGTLAWQLSNDGVGNLGGEQKPVGPEPLVVEGTLAESGILRLSVTWKDGDTVSRGFGGAAYDPEGLLPSDPPADFRTWWDVQKALLKDTPADPQLVPKPDIKPDTVATSQLSLAVLDGGRIRGWYCKPKAEGKYPAILTVPGAGVSAIGPSTGQAVAGWLSINISVHDQPLDESKEFYAALSAQGGALAGYPAQGRESRDTYYYRRVFLGFVRCIDFLTSQPEWDGKNVVVMGSSQGGGSTIVAAGLDPRVTCACANVPAMCYHDGLLSGKISGWPRLIPNAEAKDVIETAGYYDAAHFAKYITCPTLVTVGLIDQTCPATSVYAAYNAIPGEQKKLYVYPSMGHSVPPDWGKITSDWIAAHKQ
ncbi:MAG: acetylxylan esterase [Armatimonadetes bacterium]|nr:acetylxylan esterase [Armatimonadota bacterium]